MRAAFIFLGLTVLAYLPYFPLLFGSVSEGLKASITSFIGAFMGNSKIYDSFISVILLLMAPIIFYRPLLAWVAAVIGRSGGIRNAFKHTVGYYKLFLGVCVVFYGACACLYVLDSLLHCHGILLAFGAAPLGLIFDLFVAKTYEFLFLD